MPIHYAARDVHREVIAISKWIALMGLVIIMSLSGARIKCM